MKCGSNKEWLKSVFLRQVVYFSGILPFETSEMDKVVHIEEIHACGKRCYYFLDFSGWIRFRIRGPNSGALALL